MSNLTKEYPYNLGLNNYQEASLFEFTIPKRLQNSIQGNNLLFWLKNGLIWLYGSINLTCNALDIYESCAMAHWGIACSHGPNYNTLQMTKDEFPSALHAYNHTKQAYNIMNKLIQLAEENKNKNKQQQDTNNADNGEQVEHTEYSEYSDCYQLSPIECKLIHALQVRFIDPYAMDAELDAYSKALGEIYRS